MSSKKSFIGRIGEFVPSKDELSFVIDSIYVYPHELKPLLVSLQDSESSKRTVVFLC